MDQITAKSPWLVLILAMPMELWGDAAKQRGLLERALVIEEREYGSDHREAAVIPALVFLAMPMGL